MRLEPCLFSTEEGLWPHFALIVYRLTLWPANDTQEWPVVLVHCHGCLGSCCIVPQTSVSKLRFKLKITTISRQQQHSIKARSGLYWIWVIFNCASVKLALASTFYHVPSSYITVPHLWTANFNSLKMQRNIRQAVAWYAGSGSPLLLSCTLCIIFILKKTALPASMNYFSSVAYSSTIQHFFRPGDRKMWIWLSHFMSPLYYLLQGLFFSYLYGRRGESTVDLLQLPVQEKMYVCLSREAKKWVLFSWLLGFIPCMFLFYVALFWSRQKPWQCHYLTALLLSLSYNSFSFTGVLSNEREKVY